MIINEEGTYTLKYTATDECGKSSTVDRELVVTDNSPRRTVLYTDGTFIINEKQTDEAHNIELHGAATNVYDPLDENHNYGFTNYNLVYWYAERSSIKAIEFGSKIYPTNMNYWFYECENVTSFNGNNLDTSNVTSMMYMFYYCSSLTVLDLSGFDTSNVTNMNSMFEQCTNLASINLSSFDTSKVITMSSMFNRCSSLTVLDLSSFDTSGFDTPETTSVMTMFNGCSGLTTIYASPSFDVSQANLSTRMFNSMSSNLVGGAGTVWSSSNPTDKTYAHIDGGTSNPGYFTAKA